LLAFYPWLSFTSFDCSRESQVFNNGAVLGMGNGFLDFLNEYLNNEEVFKENSFIIT